MATDLFNEFVTLEFEGNQSKAAEALKLDRSMVSRLCAGERNVSPEVAAKIEALTEGRFRKERFIWPDSEPTTKAA